MLSKPPKRVTQATPIDQRFLADGRDSAEKEEAESGFSRGVRREREGQHPRCLNGKGRLPMSSERDIRGNGTPAASFHYHEKRQECRFPDWTTCPLCVREKTCDTRHAPASRLSQLRGTAPFRPAGALRRRQPPLICSPLPRKPTARTRCCAADAIHPAQGYGGQASASSRTGELNHFALKW